MQGTVEPSRVGHCRKGFSYVLNLTLCYFPAMTCVALAGSLWCSDEDTTDRGQDLTNVQAGQQENCAEKGEPGDDDMQNAEGKADDQGVDSREQRSSVGWLKPGWLGIKPATKRMPRGRLAQCGEDQVVISDSESVQPADSSGTSGTSGGGSIPCSYWTRGKCMFPNCRYLHDGPGGFALSIFSCRHWERGRCRHNPCKYSHANPGGYDDRGRSSGRSRSRRRRRAP